MGPNSYDQPPAQTPDYSFITDPGRAPKRSLLPTGGSMKQRILIVVIGAVVLIFLLAIITSLLNHKGGAIPSMVGLVEEQQEIVRIADLGVKSATGSDTQVFARITSYSVTTDQRNLTKYLATQHQKITAKQLLLKKNPQTDATLTAAAAANHYDSTFTETLKSMLTTYQLHVKQAYDQTNGTIGKGVLTVEYNNLGVLLYKPGSTSSP